MAYKASRFAAMAKLVIGARDGCRSHQNIHMVKHVVKPDIAPLRELDAAAQCRSGHELKQSYVLRRSYSQGYFPAITGDVSRDAECEVKLACGKLTSRHSLCGLTRNGSL